MTERTLANRVAGLQLTPTAIDRLVGYLSPAAGLKRMKARATMAMASFFLGAGGYTGARSDKPSLKNWNPAAGSADSDTLGDLETLRGRSRDAVRNHPIAGGAISTNVMNVVGTGLKPKSQLDFEFLGLTEDEGQVKEREFERIWEFHSDRLDVEGELTFAQESGLALRSTLESGDLLMVRRFVERPGDLLATRIQLIEADRICNERGKPNKQDHAAGVRSDRFGRPLAYDVASSHPGDIFVWPQAWEVVKVEGKAGRRAKLLFFKERPGQRRGVPYLSPVLERLKQITRYSEAELAATVVSALFTVFIKHAPGVPSDAGGLNGYVNSDGVAENVDATGAEAEPRDLQLGQASVIDLLDGEDISTANPSRPNSNFDPFWMSIVREIGIALDLPFEILVKHFQASYSASRAAFLMAWKSFRMRRQWLADGFCQLAWEWTIEEAVARGLLDAPGFLDDPMRRQAWLKVEWVGDAPGQIDELKETEAAEKRVAMGVSTLAEETARLTGGDWERKHPQRAREVKMRREAGLEVDPTALEPGAAGDDPDTRDRQERAA